MLKKRFLMKVLISPLGSVNFTGKTTASDCLRNGRLSDLHCKRNFLLKWKVMLLDHKIKHRKYCNSLDQNLDCLDISSKINQQPNDVIKIINVLEFDYTSFIGLAKSGKTVFIVKTAYKFRNDFGYIFYCDINKILGFQSGNTDLFNFLASEVTSCFGFDKKFKH